MVAPARTPATPFTLFHKLWRTHAPLTLSALLTAFVTLFFIVGLFADPRTITGAPAWLKPVKFGVSITLYSLTLTWILSLIRGRARLVAVLGWTVLVTFGLEWAAILIQVMRGTTSHFNVATPLDSALWGLMSTAIVVLWGANFIIAGLLLFQRFENPAFAWGLRLGLILTITGMGLGYLMTSPTAQQLAGWAAGASVTVVGAHTVGAPDGGPGLPLVGWSTQGGDLRAPHFVGLHALQVVPFVGWLASRRERWPVARRVALVWTASGSYLGVMGDGAACLAGATGAAAPASRRADRERICGFGHPKRRRRWPELLVRASAGGARSRKTYLRARGARGRFRTGPYLLRKRLPASGLHSASELNALWEVRRNDGSGGAAANSSKRLVRHGMTASPTRPPAAQAAGAYCAVRSYRARAASPA